MQKDELNDEQTFLDDAARGTHRSLDEVVGGEIEQTNKNRDVVLVVRDWNKDEEVKLRARLDDTLGEILEAAGRALGEKILPPGPLEPLDRLRGELTTGKWSKPITDLSQLLGDALEARFKKHFAVEYVLAVKVNTKWGIAPSSNSTPRQILQAFGMDASEFTLYPPDSNDPYPVDAPIKVKRGQKFEAHRDGRYGDGGISIGKKARGAQTIDDDVRTFMEVGGMAHLHSNGGQRYVRIGGLPIPSPPWSKNATEILIAISANYPIGGLDAFYLKLPLGHLSGDIPRKQGTVTIDNEQWELISWHYLEGMQWNPSQDDLLTHIEHCRAFFLTRGVQS